MCVNAFISCNFPIYYTIYALCITSKSMINYSYCSAFTKVFYTCVPARYIQISVYEFLSIYQQDTSVPVCTTILQCSTNNMCMERTAACVCYEVNVRARVLFSLIFPYIYNCVEIYVQIVLIVCNKRNEILNNLFSRTRGNCVNDFSIPYI